jgi:hypothetical protein
MKFSFIVLVSSVLAVHSSEYSSQDLAEPLLPPITRPSPTRRGKSSLFNFTLVYGSMPLPPDSRGWFESDIDIVKSPYNLDTTVGEVFEGWTKRKQTVLNKTPDCFNGGLNIEGFNNVAVWKLEDGEYFMRCYMEANLANTIASYDIKGGDTIQEARRKCHLLVANGAKGINSSKDSSPRA